MFHANDIIILATVVVSLVPIYYPIQYKSWRRLVLRYIGYILH